MARSKHPQDTPFDSEQDAIGRLADAAERASSEELDAANRAYASVDEEPDDDEDPQEDTPTPSAENPFRDDRPDEVKPPRKPSKLERYIRQVLSGSILTQESARKHYPYVLFMVGLMFLYIANGFHVQKLHRQHDQLAAQVKELRAKSLTIASQRMMATRQSTILEEVEKREIPLEELLVPPKVIDK